MTRRGRTPGRSCNVAAGRSESRTACVFLPLCEMIKMMPHSSTLVVLAVCVHIDDVAVQGPDEGDVQRRVVQRRALHQGVLARFNVGIGRCQVDLCGLWEQKSDNESSNEEDSIKETRLQLCSKHSWPQEGRNELRFRTRQRLLQINK